MKMLPEKLNQSGKSEELPPSLRGVIEETLNALYGGRHLEVQTPKDANILYPDPLPKDANILYPDPLPKDTSLIIKKPKKTY